MAFKIVSESVLIFRLVFWLFSWFRTFVASWKSWKSIVKIGWFWTSAFLTWVLKSLKTSQKSIQKHKQKYYKKQFKNVPKINTDSSISQTRFFMIFTPVLESKMELKSLSKSIPKRGLSPGSLKVGFGGPFWDHFGTIWGPFGDHLGTIWPPCRYILNILGSIWDHWGPFWTPWFNILEPFETIWDHWRAFGTISASFWSPEGSKKERVKREKTEKREKRGTREKRETWEKREKRETRDKREKR